MRKSWRKSFNVSDEALVDFLTLKLSPHSSDPA
jgi:predicted transcriptional regulator